VERREHLLEVATAVLLALATIGTAWCAYQSARWNGVQAIDFSEANTARSESVKQANLAAQLTAIDVGMWLQYVAAISEGNQRLADFISARFRPEFKVANDAWLATKPLQNANAPSSPFVMTEYSLAAQKRAQDLMSTAEQKTEDAKSANQQSDNYVGLTVIFASVLLFGGVGGKFESFNLRVVTLAIGAFVLVGLAFTLATYPIY